jgi:hypothetical protein
MLSLVASGAAIAAAALGLPLAAASPTPARPAPDSPLLAPAAAPWPLRQLPVTAGGAGKPTVLLTAFGGKADGATDNSAAFAKALAHLATTSGGTLVLPKQPGAESVYLTLPIRITVSSLTLVIEAGVRVLAKCDTVLTKPGDWPTVAPWANGSAPPRPALPHPTHRLA